MEGTEQCDGTPDCVLLTRGDSSDENNCGEPRRALMIHLFCAIAPVIVMLLTHLRIRLVLGLLNFSSLPIQSRCLHFWMMLVLCKG